MLTTHQLPPQNLFVSALQPKALLNSQGLEGVELILLRLALALQAVLEVLEAPSVQVRGIQVVAAEVAVLLGMELVAVAVQGAILALGVLAPNLRLVEMGGLEVAALAVVEVMARRLVQALVNMAAVPAAE
jgi:hypothetical protein